MHFFGSYLPSDVQFLLDIRDFQEISIHEKEKLIQTGEKHYSEVLTEEMEFPDEYMSLFNSLLNENISKVARNILSMCKYISTLENPILISLARAGTPYGVSIKRNLNKYFKLQSEHYSISIIIGKGIDTKALNTIIDKHGVNATYVFIDGWTGKGTIYSELKKSLASYKYSIIHKFMVLSDIAGVADICATRDDYIIPSCLLNSTVSGLISRTLINTDRDKFHGAKFYVNSLHKDLSQKYIDKIDEYIHLNNLHQAISDIIHFDKSNEHQMQHLIDDVMNKYNITNRNFIKPGVGETTRVLIRRNPDFIILNEQYSDTVQHIKYLCRLKNIKIYFNNNMPISAIGIINKFQS